MAALSIVTVKLVAIGLSIELAGNYNTAYGYLQIFGILADFGLYAVSVREVARAPAHRSFSEGGKDRLAILGNLMTLRAIILTISLSSALLIAWAIPHWQGTPLPLGITIAAFVPAFTLLAGILRTVFKISSFMSPPIKTVRPSFTITLVLAFVVSTMGISLPFEVVSVTRSWIVRVSKVDDRNVRWLQGGV